MYEEKNSTTESSVPAEDKNMSKELHNLDYVNAAPDENYDSNRTNNSGNSYLFLSFFTLFVSNFALFITHLVSLLVLTLFTFRELSYPFVYFFAEEYFRG